MFLKKLAIALFIFLPSLAACISTAIESRNCNSDSDCFKNEVCVNSKCKIDKPTDTGVDTPETNTNSSPDPIQQCPGYMTKIPKNNDWDYRFKALTTEISQCLWKKVMKQNPSFFKEAELPVERVGLDEAVKFANNLSETYGFETCYSLGECPHNQKCGKKECIGAGLQCDKIRFSEGVDCNGFRLPTEAEWEYMARSGSEEKRYGGMDRIACYRGNNDRTCRVASKAPNHWGMYDVLGNVWELTWGNIETPIKTPKQEPKNPADWSWISVRGGSFADKKEAIRFGNRGPLPIKVKRFTVGFRIVRTISP